MRRITGILAAVCLLGIYPLAAQGASSGADEQETTEQGAAEGMSPEDADGSAAADDADTAASVEEQESVPEEAGTASEAASSADEGDEQSHEIHMPKLHWSFDGVFGTFDRAALQRGFQIYTQVCSTCHSMDRLSYRNLTALGYSEEEVKAIAASHTVQDGPNDEGEMFERPGLPSDRFVNPFPNHKAAAAANNGAMPPDLSLIAKARHGGANYIYGILTGYEDPPPGHTLLNGQHWNRTMPGHVIAMPQPLQPDQVAYEDGTAQTLDQYARDVSTFLTWAAEPHMEERKRTGLKVLIFLLVFTGIMYGVKKKVWADLH